MLARLYLESNDWNIVRRKVISDNLLQARTLNTSKRFFREVSSRLKKFSTSEIEFFVDCPWEEQGYLLWIVICRRYKLIADFSTEILREKCLSLKYQLTYDDFDAFFNRKAEWHEELEGIQASTKNKLRQILFKMLRETGFLTDEHIIKPIILSPSFKIILAKNDYNDTAFFPLLSSDYVR